MTGFYDSDEFPREFIERVLSIADNPSQPAYREHAITTATLVGGIRGDNDIYWVDIECGEFFSGRWCSPARAAVAFCLKNGLPLE